jgi:hypothetical protein
MINPLKASLIADFRGLKNEPSGLKIYNLLEYLLDEIRKDNDNAPSDYVLKNQGKISVLTQLKAYLEKEK